MTAKHRYGVILLLGMVLTVLIVVGYIIFDREREAVKAEQSSHRSIRLANRKVSVGGGCNQYLPVDGQRLTSRNTHGAFVVFNHRVGAAQRRQITELGARVLGYLPDDAFSVEATPAVLEKLAKIGGVAMVSGYLPTDKIHQRFQGLSGSHEVKISLLSGEDLEVVKQAVVEHGGRMTAQSSDTRPYVRAVIDVGELLALAEMGEVRFIEVYDRPHFTNDMSAQPAAMNVNRIRSAPLGLSGQGEYISTCDSGVDTGDLTTLHQDLKDNVLTIDTISGCMNVDVTGHGTHTAGSIVGNGTMSNGKITGMATAAKLFVMQGAQYSEEINDYYIMTPEDISTLFNPHPEIAQANIGSESWGSDCAVYNTSSEAIDAYVWEHPSFLPVFAAGNDGNKGAFTVLCEGGSKNVLCVGAVGSGRFGFTADERAPFSSYGPMADGRAKPDVTAPGIYILSTKSTLAGVCWEAYNDYYCYNGGTSMSTPLAAGSAALVREWLRTEQGFTNPSAALVKAVMMGGARYEVRSLDIADSIAPSGDMAVAVYDMLPFVEGTNVQFTVTTTNAAPLDVQLVWIDYPGDCTASDYAPKLVNDLDLMVTITTNEVTDVWLGGGDIVADTLNNHEQVSISNAVPTTYTIEVKSSLIRYDSTEGGAAALYIRGAFDPASISMTTNSLADDMVSISLCSKLMNADGSLSDLYSDMNITARMVTGTVFTVGIPYSLPLGYEEYRIFGYGRVILSEILQEKGGETNRVVDAMGRIAGESEFVADDDMVFDFVYCSPSLLVGSSGNRLPRWWYMRNMQSWAEQNGIGEDEVASADADADGFTNWQEYYLGLDPLDEASKLQIDIDMSSGQPVLRCTPESISSYFTIKYQGVENLGDEWSDADYSRHRFFRLQVE